tara:strand:+ start:836 stop:2035 length:1200 start_codon:yes stop_codon:yes gene_type:complete
LAYSPQIKEQLSPEKTRSNSGRSLTVFIACSGIGHINRGYETFASELFHALKTESQFDVRLLSGGVNASSADGIIPCVYRESSFAKALSFLLRRDTYTIEQLTFALMMIPTLWRRAPDIIIVSDGGLGNFLWHIRQRLKFDYKILFSNGGPSDPPFLRFDHTHQVLASNYKLATEAGQPDKTQTLVPYGFDLGSSPLPASVSEINDLRQGLHLPVDKPIVISIGAINHSHKRMDYVIREVAKLPKETRPFLLMLGQRSDESSEIAECASELLGPNGFTIRSVSPEQVADYCRASNLFTLASLSEGFGRVLIEALSCGLECLVHDAEFTRETLKEWGTYGDFSSEGTLTSQLKLSLSSAPPWDSEAQRQRCDYAQSHYSWKNLTPHYVDMIYDTCLPASH